MALKSATTPLSGMARDGVAITAHRFVIQDTNASAEDGDFTNSGLTAGQDVAGVSTCDAASDGRTSFGYDTFDGKVHLIELEETVVKGDKVATHTNGRGLEADLAAHTILGEYMKGGSQGEVVPFLGQQAGRKAA